MVNYKGGNARDLKNFRRQKAQNRRLTDADGDESASEYEASGSQAYAAATPSLNMENTHHCYPSPRATLSPHGTSFLGGNTNSFNFFQPHMLLTQAESTSNTAPQQLGTASGLVPFVPSQAGDNGANEPAFEDQGLEGPSAVLGTLHG